MAFSTKLVIYTYIDKLIINNSPFNGDGRRIVLIIYYTMFY